MLTNDEFGDQTRANILVQQGFHLHEVSMQYGLNVKVLCTQI